MEHIKIEIIGRFTKHARLTAEEGYCIYDVDDESPQYTTLIYTPIVDVYELSRKYKSTWGSVEELNSQNEE